MNTRKLVTFYVVAFLALTIAVGAAVFEFRTSDNLTRLICEDQNELKTAIRVILNESIERAELRGDPTIEDLRERVERIKEEHLVIVDCGAGLTANK